MLSAAGMRSAKVIAKAFSAGFRTHRVQVRVCATVRWDPDMRGRLRRKARGLGGREQRDQARGRGQARVVEGRTDRGRAMGWSNLRNFLRGCLGWNRRQVLLSIIRRDIEPFNSPPGHLDLRDDRQIPSKASVFLITTTTLGGQPK